MEKEQWKPIERFDGEYMVSNFGRVRSLKRHKDRIMPQTIQRRGYLACTFWMNNKAKCVKVHRLVAETFIPNPNNLPEINHIDGDKLNNLASNLEWCTRSQNVKHSFDIGLKTPHRWTADERKAISNALKGRKRV